MQIMMDRWSFCINVFYSQSFIKIKHKMCKLVKYIILGIWDQLMHLQIFVIFVNEKSTPQSWGSNEWNTLYKIWQSNILIFLFPLEIRCLFEFFLPFCYTEIIKLSQKSHFMSQSFYATV